jgi:hypothetical protein
MFVINSFSQTVQKNQPIVLCKKSSLQTSFDTYSVKHSEISNVNQRYVSMKTSAIESFVVKALILAYRHVLIISNFQDPVEASIASGFNDLWEGSISP